MQTKKILILLVLLVLLSACGSGENQELAPTEIPEAAEVVNTEPVYEDIQHSEAICTAQSQAVVEDVIQEGDWVEGAEQDYNVTIIEYGDFQ